MSGPRSLDPGQYSSDIYTGHTTSFPDPLNATNVKGQYQFPKHEHLKSAIFIGWLFRNGRSLTRPPLFIKYDLRQSSDEKPAGLKAAFTVSRKNFKRAVDRNRIKRLLREAFRLNVPSLREELKAKGQILQLIIVFTGKEIPTLDLVEKKMVPLLNKIAQSL